MLLLDISPSLDYFVLRVGSAILAAHCSLYVLFAHVLPRGPWTSLPSFTAHQAVCLPLMVYLSYVGSRAWFFPSAGVAVVGTDDLFAGSADRIVEVVPEGERISKIVLAMQLFWDIPVGLTTAALRDPLMAAHHVGMALVSGAGAGLYSNGKSFASYYSPFFFGVVEISSIFLTVVDVFHPKQKPWFDYLQSGRGGGTLLAAINDLCRMAFALSYLVLRAAYFPYVVVTGILPDCRAVIDMSEEERPPLVLPYGIAVFSILFAALQVHWGVLVARQTLKAIGLGGGDSRKEKKRK